MIDIHSHVVWGLDDGASSLDDSLTMLRTAAEDGITEIVATPHSNAQYRFQPGLLRLRMEELTARCQGKPVVHRGCEFQVTIDNIAPLLDSPSAYTINGGPYLLLEFPDFHIGKHSELVLRQLLDGGIVPIVAHPERNPLLLRDLDRLESWIERGCLAQVTALSITGGFGGPTRSAALRLLDRGLVHVVASDAHDPRHRPPVLSAASDTVRARLGEEAADLLFTENPRGIVQGHPVAGGKLTLAGPPKKSWWKSCLWSEVG